ncbi:uncharacterized protein LOC125863984 [Solanum stenotomum]|uniref:uncharacterized protein LOC125863984 n=1 Tax=Solanum stenotomum TaxID=172797 RepID=UPI0020D1D509|nr:uncharacterized protein LOC125863984 [Solanum stenotomum]
MLSQVVTNQARQQRGNRQDVVDTSRIHEFLRMNHPYFTGSSVNEDPKNFVEDLQKVFDGVARIWYDQWKKRRAKGAPIVSWVMFEEALMGRFLSRELIEAKPNGLAPSSVSALAPRDKECPKNRKGNGNGGNRAQSSLVAVPDRVAPRGATSGTCRGANRLYAITSC